jgi:hypothetical protein
MKKNLEVEKLDGQEYMIGIEIPYQKHTHTLPNTPCLPDLRLDLES